MNKWKIAFFLSLMVLFWSAYTLLDQGVSLSYMQDGYGSTKRDLEVLIEIINEGAQERTALQEVLARHFSPDSITWNQDTIPLESVALLLENDRFIGFLKQW